jgi:hypothetical protein
MDARNQQVMRKWTHLTAIFVGLPICTTEKYHSQCTNSKPFLMLLQDKYIKLKYVLLYMHVAQLSILNVLEPWL